jgi:hypothetical protein
MMVPPNAAKRREAHSILNLAAQAPAGTSFVVHYVCQSLFKDGARRITAIAIKQIGGETRLFSLKLQGNLIDQKVIRALSEHKIDVLEFDMLARFGTFMQEHQQCLFVNWAMRDSTYGFPAIRDRQTALAKTLRKGKAAPGQHLALDCKKLDLSTRLNEIPVVGLIPGMHEPEYFASGNWHALDTSVQVKVGLIAQFFDLACRDQLKTNKNWFHLKRSEVTEFSQSVWRHPVRALVAAFLAVAIPAYTLWNKP